MFVFPQPWPDYKEIYRGPNTVWHAKKSVSATPTWSALIKLYPRFASAFSILYVPDCFYQRRTSLARKTVRISDMSGEEIAEGKGASVRVTFADARKGSRELDVTDAEAEKLGGRVVGRRGRKPKTQS
jgi:hypothetical protein